MIFLQKFKLHLGRALQERGPVNVSAATDVMWKTGWSRGHASKLELAKKAVSCAQPRYYRAVGWKSQEITAIVLLVLTKKMQATFFF